MDAKQRSMDNERLEPYLFEEKKPLLFLAKERAFRLEYNEELTEARFMAVRLDEISYYHIRNERIDPERFKTEEEFTKHMTHVIEKEYDEAVSQGYLFPWYFLITHVHFREELNGGLYICKDNGDKEAIMIINEDMRKFNACRLSEKDSFFATAKVYAEARFGYCFAIYKWVDKLGRNNYVALPYTTPVNAQ